VDRGNQSQESRLAVKVIIFGGGFYSGKPHTVNCCSSATNHATQKAKMKFRSKRRRRTELSVNR
jgi:hypothetical protein